MDEVSDGAVILLANRRFERNRLDRDSHHFANAIHRKSDLARDLFFGCFTLQFLLEPRRGLNNLVDQLGNVHRNPDRSTLIDDGPGDSAANPPSGVGAEPESLSPVKLLDRAN